MRNFKLILEYDGSAFSGFQKQPHRPTVQEALEKALTRFFGHKLKINAASSRTDAGVHAIHQVVNFKVRTDYEPAEILKALNGILPKPVVVRKIEEVPARFHARFQAKIKTYEYLIWNSRIRTPLLAARTYQVIPELAMAPMRKAAKILTGRHDFRTFCAKADGEKDTVRTIKIFSITRKGSLIRIKIGATGFLYHMVRNIAGTLVDVGRGKLSLEALEMILKSRDRRRAGTTAPGHALTLTDVTY